MVIENREKQGVEKGKKKVKSVDFDEVLHQELDRLRGPRNPQDPEEPPPALRRAHEAQLVGLAFSGGGIRSATFNLGVLQGLANLRLIRIFDYLSTVSGGGYIGAWLQAWVERSADFRRLDHGASLRSKIA